MEIILIVLFVILIISNRSLANRVSNIEEKLKFGFTEKQVTTEPEPIAQTEQFSPEHEPVVQTTQNAFVPERAERVESNRFIAWLKEDWLMKLGVALFIVGFGWFVSYAFMNNWIGPVGRITLGIFAGIIIMVFGFRRMMRYPSQGASFMALGAAMAMLTIFAGRSIYGFFTPATAVFFDFIIAAFVSFASYKFNTQPLAFVAQILAFLSPLLVAGQTNSVFLFSYLFFISLATLILAGITGWRGLISTSLFFVGLYSIPYIFSGWYGLFGGRSSVYSQDAPIILNFAYLFAVLYLFSGMLAVIKKGVQDLQNEIFIAVLNGLFLFFWIYNIAPKDWSVFVFTAWAIVFTISSFMVFRFSSKLAPFFAYGAVAVAFIAAATAEQLSGATLTIAFAIEALLLVIIVFTLTKNAKATLAASWLLLAPAVLSVANAFHYSSAREVFTEDFFVLLIMAFSFIFVGRLVDTVSSEQTTDSKKPSSFLVIAGTIYIWYLLWQVIHIAMRPDADTATMITLIIYTVFGLIAYFWGLYKNDYARRVYGIFLLGFVILRLIFIDVWHMELFGRVVTFIVIGVLLMSTAFLTKNRKKELRENNYQN